VRGSQAVRVGSDLKRASASILGGHPLKRTADNLGRFARGATLRPQRIAREAYETAALPLSYVGAEGILATLAVLSERLEFFRVSSLAASAAPKDTPRTVVPPAKDPTPGFQADQPLFQVPFEALLSLAQAAAAANSASRRGSRRTGATSRLPTSRSSAQATSPLTSSRIPPAPWT
jgi:hypothetical protein